MPLYELRTDGIKEIEAASFADLDVRERQDLQRLIRINPTVLGEELFIIAEEFGEFEESRRRIDLLALDSSANLVVIEIKRTEDGGHMELQAIRYAAMISAMTVEQVTSIAARTQGCTEEEALQKILKFLDWSEMDSTRFAQDVRIVLVSSNFGRELTTAVLRLNEYDIDIRCVRMKPHRDGERIIVDVHQIIPLPEASDYIEPLRKKEDQERQDRRKRSLGCNLPVHFWAQLQKKATAEGLNLHSNIQPESGDSLKVETGYCNTTIGYIARKGWYRVQLDISGDNPKATFDALFDRRA